MPNAYTFRPVRPDDIALLRRWRSSRHWIACWGAPEPEAFADLLKPRRRHAADGPKRRLAR